MKKIISQLTFTFLIAFLFSCSQPNEEAQSAQIDFENLVWSDEFDYDGKPDPAKWTYDLGDGCPNICGWGNNELEYYTDSLKNVRVENGSLIIELHQDSIKGKGFTSGRIKTKGKQIGFMAVLRLKLN